MTSDQDNRVPSPLKVSGSGTRRRYSDQRHKKQSKGRLRLRGVSKGSGKSRGLLDGALVWTHLVTGAASESERASKEPGDEGGSTGEGLQEKTVEDSKPPQETHLQVGRGQV